MHVVLLVAIVAMLAPPVGASAGPICGTLQRFELGDGFVLCTHGDDDLAPADTPSGGTADRSGPVHQSAPVQCYGDGADGERVEVYYVRPSGAADRSADLAPDLVRWVEQVEWSVNASAQQQGGRRHVRWATERGSQRCTVSLRSATVSAGAIGDFAATVDELRAQGLTRADRKYLLFVEDDTYCGLGSAPEDDQAGSANLANRQPGYARVDEPCWDTGDLGYYSIAAHELVHTLGAVQQSAPHGTEGRHCSDEYDLMCYGDGTGVDVTYPCQDGDPATGGRGDANERLLDCGADDYFAISPTSGSYLATHWNVARSAFLSDVASTDAGYPSTSAATPDPAGRPQVWPSSSLGGPHRPTLAGGFGWEVCDLPVEVAVADDAASQALVAPVRDAVAAVNGGAGTTIVRFAGEAVGVLPADGQVVVRAGAVTERSQVDLGTRDARIRRATVTIDTGVASSLRPTVVLQALVQALGVGRSGVDGTLMAAVPVPGADTTTAMLALRHLYAQSCDVDPRLDDTASGHATQRRTGGSRRQVDLATASSSVVEAAVSVGAWLRGERGKGWAGRAVICRDDVFADCLAGTALAGTTGIVMLVPGGPDGRLPSSVRDELDASLGSMADIVILGGPSAVSSAVEQDLHVGVPGRSVRRIAGADRYATAAEVAAEVAPEGADEVLIARGDNPVDAVAAGAWAAERGVPILLATPERLPEATRAALGSLGAAHRTILGGTAAIHASVGDVLRVDGTVRRVAGRTRTETTVAIARSLWQRTSAGTRTAFVALNGWDPAAWALVVAAAPVATYLDAPILFTDRDDVPSLAPEGVYPGGVREYVTDLALTATPDLTTVTIGAAGWSGPSLARRFHSAVLPAFDGNVAEAAVSASTGSSSSLIPLLGGA